MGLVLDLWLRFNRNRHVRKVTGSKVTGFYAALSISYSAIQVIFLAASWQVTHGAGRQFEVLVEASGNGTKEFSYLDYTSGSPQLRLCPGGISRAQPGDYCPVIWPELPSSEAPARRGESVVFSSTNNTITLEFSPNDSFTVDGNRPTSSITLDQDCVQAIKWPYHHLLLLRREDIVAACFHAWLFIMSVTALMQESIPHIGSSFLLHVLALGWSSVQIWATWKFDVDYHYIIAGPQGACAGVDLISGYFKEKRTYQIATLVVNFVSTIASGFLCWRLFGMYGWLTFKKMGASRTIARAYKCALALSICIQLEIFLYVASVGCILDQILKGLLGAKPTYKTAFLAGYITSTICVVPWLWLAWYGIRRESKRMMYGFFALSILYLGASGATFASATFRRTFRYWSFVVTEFSFSWAILVAIIVLAIICTRNFGKGLPHYLERRNGEEDDDYSADFHPSPDERLNDLEKVSFPSAGSEDAVMIAFPSELILAPVKRSESASSQMSQESRGSTRLPPLQVTSEREMPRIIIPPLAKAVPGRNLTASAQSQAASYSTISPSWTPGDDSAMMTKQKPVQRFNTASSFGNLDSAQMHSLDRDFSFGTQASSNIVVPINAPQRSLTTSSQSSVASTSSTYSYGTPGRKKRIDLGEEL